MPRWYENFGVHDRVLGVRVLFEEYVNSLPAPLDNLARQFAKSKEMADIIPGALHAELHAYWIGELFGIKDNELLSRAAFSSVLAATYIVIQDKRIDEPNFPLAFETEVVGNLLFAKSLESFHSLTGWNPQFWTYVQQYLIELSSAYIHERAKRDDPTSVFGEEDIMMVAHRSAPEKILVASLALASNKHDLISPLSEMVDNLAFGLQIRDDLTDWREDLVQRRLTYPIYLALVSLRDTVKSLSPSEVWPNEDTIADALYLYGTAEELLEDSSKYLKTAKKQVELIPGAGVGLYLDALIRENEEVRRSLLEKKIKKLSEWDVLQDLTEASS